MSQGKESPKLTIEQIEMLANFSHASEEYPDLSFEEVALKLLGSEPFQPTPNGKQFEKECKEVFDRERKPWGKPN
jgi:hypothetical protein